MLVALPPFVRMLFVPSIRLGALAGGAAITAQGLYALACSTSGSWRYGFLDAATCLIVCIMIALISRATALSPYGIALAGTALLCVAANATWALLCVGALIASSCALGSIIRRDPDDTLSNTLVGLVAFGVVMYPAVMLHAVYPATCLLLIALPFTALGAHSLHALHRLASVFARNTSGKPYTLLLESAVSSLVLRHAAVILMPETGHDALAINLFIPYHIREQHGWGFDASAFSFATLPFLVHWLYTLVVVPCDETAARLLNGAGLCICAAYSYTFTSWARASHNSGTIAALLFLSTPLTYLESSSLFVEPLWSAFLLSALYHLSAALFTPATVRDFYTTATLLAGAVAAKAVALPLLTWIAPLGCLGVRSLPSLQRSRTVLVCVILFVGIGGLPYALSYAFTGNPVFPFFNGHFRSPFFPPEDFRPPAQFDRGLKWDTLFRMTFNSGQFLEATPGASGFHWILLGSPGIVALALARNWRGLVICTIVVATMWTVFAQTAYLRYVLPAFVLSCSVAAIGLAALAATTRTMQYVSAFACFSVLCLNMLHFQSASWYGQVKPSAITSPRGQRSWLLETSPIRLAVRAANTLNLYESPVAFFCQPFGAELYATPLYANWYNIPFWQAALRAQTEEEFLQMLNDYHVELLIVDPDWEDAVARSFALRVSDEVMSFNGISLRRVRE